MSKVDDINKSIQNMEQPKSLLSLIEGSMKELKRALPSHLSPERMVRIALTSIRLNPELAKCTPESFLGSLFTLAQLGLEPVAGRAYLLPFNNKRKIGNEWKTIKEVQAIIGYRGLADLFYRHESSVSIDMQTVKENDLFDYMYGTESYLNHKPSQGERGPTIGYYAVAKMNNGGSVFRYMTWSDAMEHGKKHSKSYDKYKNEFNAYSPWAKEPDAMCMKTVLIQLSKLLPLSIEMQRAIAADETSRDFKKDIDDALDMPVTTEWNLEKAQQQELLEKGDTNELQQQGNKE
jgi:recombination protein RecT